MHIYDIFSIKIKIPRSDPEPGKERNIYEKVFCFLLMISIVLSFSGCSVIHMARENATKERSGSSDSDSEGSEESVSFEELLIQGLDNRDAGLIKSLFSEEALSVCTDIDVGIQYMFDIYEGKFERRVHEGTSTTKHYEDDRVITMAEPIYIIKTTADKYYKIKATYWKCDKPGFSRQGLYSMYFLECEADTKGAGGGPWIAGINYPERDAVDNAIDTYIYSATRSKPEELRKEIDEDVLSKDNNAKKIDKYISAKDRLSYNGIGNSWAVLSEGKKEGYLLLDTRPKQCIYVSVDPESDKIIGFKVTLLEDDKPLDDYDLSLSEPGIIVP